MRIWNWLPNLQRLVRRSKGILSALGRLTWGYAGKNCVSRPIKFYNPAVDWKSANSKEILMRALANSLWRNDEGQDIAEYAVMLAVILVIVIGTIRLIGTNANNVFSSVASSIQ
jgi:Flp pilus assembly pilin Flp